MSADTSRSQHGPTWARIRHTQNNPRNVAKLIRGAKWGVVLTRGGGLYQAAMNEAERARFRFNSRMDMGTRAAWALSEEAVDWLGENYGQFEFWVERDLVWTLQTRLRTMINERGLPFAVLSDYGMLPGPRRSLSADLVIRDAAGQVLVAAEFKYEPSHLRPEFRSQPGKLPVVFWGADGVAKDVARIRQFVEAGAARAAFAMFLDRVVTSAPGRRILDPCGGTGILRGQAVCRRQSCGPSGRCLMPQCPSDRASAGEPAARCGCEGGGRET